MNSAKRRIEFPHHLGERQFKRRPPSDQHIIMTAVQTSRDREPHQLPQAPPHTVALHGVADLPRYRKSDPHFTFGGALACLQHKRPAGRPHSSGGSAKVRSALQPLHGRTMLEREKHPSRTKALASVCPPRRHNLATALGRHAGAKAMAPFAHQFARLVGSFHESRLRQRAWNGRAMPTWRVGAQVGGLYGTLLAASTRRSAGSVAARPKKPQPESRKSQSTEGVARHLPAGAGIWNTGEATATL